MEDAFLGLIAMFGFNFAPRGWALCQGQLLNISQFTGLFALLGTTYGGDGRINFGLPDLRGRVPVGVGQGGGGSTYQLGETGGQESVTMTVEQMPTHTHTATATSTTQVFGEDTPGTGSLPKTHVLAGSGDTTKIYAPSGGSPVQMASESASTSTNVTIANAGGNQAVTNMQPFLAVNYCICVQGIFPPRN